MNTRTTLIGLQRSAAGMAMWAALAAHAGVVPLSPGSNVFLDQAHGLLWSQPDAFAASTYANAQAAVAAATIEGLSEWYLPSLAQFQGLYQIQGTVPTGDPRPDYDEIMVESPFSGMQPTWYWTTDVFSGNAAENLAFSPTGANTNPFFRTTVVNVWAVHEYRPQAVPEPGTGLLAGFGMMLVALVRRRSVRESGRPDSTASPRSMRCQLAS